MTGRNQITVNHLVPKPKNKSNTETLQNTAQNSALNSSTSAGNEKAITGGGPKVINITIQKFLDNINIHTTNFKEGEQNIESIFMEMFARVMVQEAQAQ
jgi:hypothetical protein